MKKSQIPTLLVALVVLLFGAYVWQTKTKGTDTPVDQTETTNQETAKFSDVEMQLPAGWKVLSVTDKKLALQTAYEPYRVTLGIDYSKEPVTSDEEYALYKIAQNGTASIYQIPCAGGVAGCFRINIGQDSYVLTVAAPESNQPIPSTIDGPWTPDSDVTDTIIETMITSLQKSN